MAGKLKIKTEYHEGGEHAGDWEASNGNVHVFAPSEAEAVGGLLRHVALPRGREATLGRLVIEHADELGVVLVPGGEAEASPKRRAKAVGLWQVRERGAASGHSPALCYECANTLSELGKPAAMSQTPDDAPAGTRCEGLMIDGRARCLTAEPPLPEEPQPEAVRLLKGGGRG